MVMGIPDPGQVAIVISDGTRWAASHISRAAFEAEPARAVAEAMKALDGAMTILQQEGVTAEPELRNWAEADIMRTPRGYALSPAALEGIMRADTRGQANGDNN
jgi:hypothetical protein